MEHFTLLPTPTFVLSFGCSSGSYCWSLIVLTFKQPSVALILFYFFREQIFHFTSCKPVGPYSWISQQSCPPLVLLKAIRGTKNVSVTVIYTYTHTYTHTPVVAIKYISNIDAHVLLMQLFKHIKMI